MTTEECYRLREERGFTSPLKPLERGQMFCTFATRGTYEWLVNVDDVSFLLENGVKVDGVRMDVTAGEDWPLMNAVMVTARCAPVETYIDPTKT